VRLVGDELPELAEAPGMLDAPLRLANREPLADALELLQRDAATCVLGLRDQVLANDVVGVAGETGLLRRRVLSRRFADLVPSIAAWSGVAHDARKVH